MPVYVLQVMFKGSSTHGQEEGLLTDLFNAMSILRMPGSDGNVVEHAEPRHLIPRCMMTRRPN